MATTLKKILIAEDEKPLAKAIELKLRKSGFDPKCVYNGEDAVTEILNNNYDLVLLDMMMPKKNGFDVLKDVKAKGNNTKIFITSNLSQDSDIAEAKALGAIDFFVKSDTSIVELAEKIKNFLK